MSIKVSIHGKNCGGCLREGKPIMLSLDGKDSEGAYKFLDAFLTNEEVEELIIDLKNIMLENEGIKMGHKIIQKVYVCDCCGSTPEDGEVLWEMASEYICEKCFEDDSYDEYIEAKEN